MLAIAPLQEAMYSSLVLAPETRSHRFRYRCPSSSGSGRRTTLTRPDSNASYTEKSETSHSNRVPSGLAAPDPYHGGPERSAISEIEAASLIRSMILFQRM